MKRRDLVAMLVGSAVALPRPVDAQQSPMPVIGFLNGFSPEERPSQLAAFKQGLSEGGFVEGHTVVIEYRWAHAQLDRLPVLAADLVQRRVDVIVTSGGDEPAHAAKAATQTIPIVAVIGDDPVTSGLVGSLNRPGGNLTGISIFHRSLVEKRLELLHELIPAAMTIALLVDAQQMDSEASVVTRVQAAAQKLGVQIVVVKASTVADLDTAFGALARDRVGAVLTSTLPIWSNTSIQGRLIALAAQHAIPVGYYSRDQAEAGGLMSYGTSPTGVYRQVGAYAARVLKGDKPADLPVQQPTTFDLVINLKTAKALGLTVPPTLLATADEVIE